MCTLTGLNVFTSEHDIRETADNLNGYFRYLSCCCCCFRKRGKVGKAHRITKDAAIKWFVKKYDGIVLDSRKKGAAVEHQ